MRQAGHKPGGLLRSRQTAVAPGLRQLRDPYSDDETDNDEDG
ncbi:hypothetical protein [Streptomyces sp. NPDC046942]